MPHAPLAVRGLVSVLASMVFVGGCADRPERSPTTSESVTASPQPSVVLRPQQQPVMMADAQLTIEQLVEIALEHTPSRAIYDADRRLAQALVTQATAWANPELELEGGRARATDGDHLSIGRVGVRQRFELPEKRERRIDAARSQQAVAASDAEALRADLENSVREASVTLAVLQLSVPETERAAALAHQVSQVVQRRTDGGEATRSDLLRAQVDALQADQEHENGQRSLRAARGALVALCAGAIPSDVTVDVDLTALPDIAVAEVQDDARQHNPRLLRLDAVIEQRRREILREQAAAYPDFSVGAFTSKEVDSRSVGVTVGVDLPLWNRNQGGIAEARAQLDRDEAERAQQRLTVAAEVQDIWSEYDAAIHRVRSYVDTLTPAAHEALDLALRSYEAGETGLLDLLDARRTAQGIERARLDALEAAQLARIRLDRAIGRASARHP